MKVTIKDWRDGREIWSGEAENIAAALKVAVANNVNLSWADLSKADLSKANLSKADLSWANLFGANLSWANLFGANLSWADLSKADLSKANLSWADLSKANLSKANLSEANLSKANLSKANLSWADLYKANLSWADLYKANLSEANLYKANLSEANLSEANLSKANLSWADLYKANLSWADLSGAKEAALAQAMTEIVPRVGSFEGWKQCAANDHKVVVRVLIPEKAKRSNATGRKCRAEFVEVLEVVGAEVGISLHDSKTEYRAGQTVTCHEWCDNRFEECAGGIHFYMTREEAEAY